MGPTRGGDSGAEKWEEGEHHEISGKRIESKVPEKEEGREPVFFSVFVGLLEPYRGIGILYSSSQQTKCQEVGVRSLSCASSLFPS